MYFKKLFMLIFFVFVLSLFVFAVDQEVTVDILTVPSIFLGNNSGEDNEIDTDGTVFATLGNNVTRFFVDATAPKIKETLPKKKDYTNGSFSIEYDEEFLHNITLNYNGSSTKLDCPSGKKQICYFYVDLSEHNNDTINYYFEVRDMFFKTVQRKPFAVKVDTVVPEITKLNFTVDRRRVEFDVEISEEVDLLYYHLNSTRPRWISLCRNCDGYNKKKSFRTGDHNLIIMASDKASNSDQE